MEQLMMFVMYAIGKTTAAFWICMTIIVLILAFFIMTIDKK